MKADYDSEADAILLERAAQRFDLDPAALLATAQAALAAPDREVRVELDPRLPAGGEAKTA